MDPLQLTYDVCRGYIRDLPSSHCPEPLRKKLLGYVRSRNLASLADAQALYDSACHGIDVFRSLRQVEALFKKNKTFIEESICEPAAYENFLLGEKLCRITNRRLDFYYAQPDRNDPDLRLWISKMQFSIANLLSGGAKEDLDGFTRFLEELPRRIRVTSGATSTLSRRKSIPYLKLGRRIDCTPSAVPYLEALRNFYGYSAPTFRTTVTNRVEFVPKNWKTHRTMACEPTGNVPLQLAFDAYVKDRLPRWGCDLHNQFRNQELAKEGSISGEYATIDLSMASDTLAYNVVHLLFPSRWARYLSDVRSPCWKDKDGSFKTYAKFSSMGNGATFAIETLVFASACLAVGAKPGKFVVYGDDIIIPTCLVAKLNKLLAYLGFRLNQAKSYTEGPFRESCGTDWFNGIDVTPFYIRILDNRKAILCHNINGLASVVVKEGELSRTLISLIEENKLPFVPYNYSTTSGIFVDVQTAYSQGLLRTNHDRKRDPRWTPRFKGYLIKETRRVADDSRQLFLYFLQKYGIVPREEPNERSTTRVSTLRHKYVREWVDWYPPVTGTPVHLYWWAELALRGTAAK